MKFTEATKALLAGWKYEINKNAQPNDGDIPMAATNSDDPESERLKREEHLMFAASIRRLIGFLRARDLIHAMPFVNSWCKSPEETKGSFEVQLEAVHESLALLTEWWVKVSEIEKPILDQLENHASALEAKVLKATLEHEVPGAMHDEILLSVE